MTFNGISVYQVGGQGTVSVSFPPVQSPRSPTTNDKVNSDGAPYNILQPWFNTTTQQDYLYFGGGTWVLVSNGSGVLLTLSDTANAKALPDATGNIQLAGTANQITVTTGTNKETFTIPSVFIAPGSIAATTTVTGGTGVIATTGNITASAGNVSASGTVTGGTGVTATTGNVTASAGNFVSTISGNGLLLNSPSNSGAASGPVVVNGRSGRVTFTTVSIAAAADLTLTLTNSAITASTTEVLLSMSGATTGSALSIKSKTASSGSLAIVVTNGTGATTTTADIQFDFLVLNA